MKDTVVVAHPDPTKRRSFETLCSEYGIAVLGSCSDGATAVDMVSRFRPLLALVSADLVSPPAKETIRRIREVTQNRCKIVLLCANLEDASVHEIDGIGADAYAPLNQYIEDISDAILSALQRRRSSLSARQPPIPATIAGRYRIERSLDLDGGDSIYRATDMTLRRSVALTRLPPRFAEDLGRVSQLRETARVLATLNHPNLIVIFDLLVERAESYLVTENIRGRSLRSAIELGGISHWTAIDLVIQTADALAAVHSRNIIHGHISPENLVVIDSKYVKVINFQFTHPRSYVRPDQSVDETASTGTAADYWSPEQAAGLPVGYSTDIFSLGIVLYELLSGRHPFRRSSPAFTLRAIINDNLPQILETPMNDAWDILVRALQKNPHDRYTTIAQFAADLRMLRSQSPGTQGSVPE